jgi:ATP phosphoribosyltransferase
MMSKSNQPIRIALPSKGRLAGDTLDLLAKSGLEVNKTNPRQYEASLPALPQLTVLFQRAGDIAVSVRDGVVDFGITGLDVVREKQNGGDAILVMLDALGFGECSLYAIVPESETEVNTVSDVPSLIRPGQSRLRIATKFPNLTQQFFAAKQIPNADVIVAEGALEIAPVIGYADMITDLVSTGITLRDNRLKVLDGGLILDSQACLIANRKNLMESDAVMEVAHQLLEFIVAYLRAENNVSVFANIRGESPEAVAERILGQRVIRGLQGPTISRVITHQGEDWYAAHLIVAKAQLAEAIREIREIGGSGVVVMPVKYIFEEEPEAYRRLLRELEVSHD